MVTQSQHNTAQAPQPAPTVIRTPRAAALFPGWGVRF
jgi:hypothetical protein